MKEKVKQGRAKDSWLCRSGGRWVLRRTGGRRRKSRKREGAADDSGFGLAELYSHCLIHEESSHVRMSNRMEIGEDYMQLLETLHRDASGP